MRYIIYGAGAIGGLLGARLFAAGHSTVLICRGAHLDAIRANGLVLRDPEQERRLQIAAVGHPRELHFTDQDVVVLTMKSQDTAAALDDLEAAGGWNLPVVCCQNGVENERLAARRFARVYGMVTGLPAEVRGPGVVLAWGTPYAGVLDAGAFPSGTDPLIEQIAADVSSAGFICRADPAVMRLKYAKILTNLWNGLQVLVPLDRRDEGVRAMMRNLRNEALACFKAAGIECAGAEEYRGLVEAPYAVAATTVAGDQRSGASTLQGLARGQTRLELDYINGEIVLLGKIFGVPTPYNAVLRRMANHVAATGAQTGAFTLDDLRRAAEAASPTFGPLPQLHSLSGAREASVERDNFTRRADARSTTNAGRGEFTQPADVRSSANVEAGGKDRPAGLRLSESEGASDLDQADEARFAASSDGN